MDDASPRFRKDLEASATEADGVACVDVRDPSTGTNFRFYDFEYQLALQFNGQPLRDVTVWASRDLRRRSDRGRHQRVRGAAVRAGVPGDRRAARRPTRRRRSARKLADLDNAEAEWMSAEGAKTATFVPDPGCSIRPPTSRRSRPSSLLDDEASPRRRADGRSDAAARQTASRPTRRGAAPVRHPVARRDGARRRRTPARPTTRHRRQRAREARGAGERAREAGRRLGRGPRRHAAIAGRGAHPGRAPRRPRAVDQKTPTARSGLASASPAGAAPPPAAPAPPGLPSAGSRPRPKPSRWRRSRRRARRGGQAEAARRDGSSASSSCCWRSRASRTACGRREHSRVPQAVRVRVLSPKPAAVYRWFSGRGTVTDHEARTLAFDSAGTPGRAAAARNGVRGGRHPGPAARRATDRGAAQPHSGRASRSISRCATACARRTTSPSCARRRSSWRTSSGWSTRRPPASRSWSCAPSEPGEVVETLAKVGTPVQGERAARARQGADAARRVRARRRRRSPTAAKLGFCRVEVVGLGPRASNAERRPRRTARRPTRLARSAGGAALRRLHRREARAGTRKKLRVALPDNLGLVPGQPLRLARQRYDAVFPVPAAARQRRRRATGRSGSRARPAPPSGATSSVADAADDALVSDGLRVGDEVIVDAPADLRAGARDRRRALADCRARRRRQIPIRCSGIAGRAAARRRRCSRATSPRRPRRRPASAGARRRPGPSSSMRVRSGAARGGRGQQLGVRGPERRHLRGQPLGRPGLARSRRQQAQPPPRSRARASARTSLCSSARMRGVQRAPLRHRIDGLARGRRARPRPPRLRQRLPLLDQAGVDVAQQRAEVREDVHHLLGARRQRHGLASVL